MKQPGRKQPSRKARDKNKPRESYEGAKPLKYHDGKLYYLKNELLEDATQKRVPSQQPAKFKFQPPKLNVPALIKGALAATKEPAA
jgi:hypothetical protein